MLRASSLALAAALAASSMASPPGETQALAEANHRWGGARCRTRQEITVRKKADGDGWSRSEWLWYGGKRGGNERVLVLFTNAAALHARYPGGTIPPGVELVGVGWATEKPDGKGDLYLELQHPDLGARARIYYYADWVGRVPVSRLGEFERWARLELLDIVQTPEESLDEVAPAAPPVAPATVPPSVAPSAPGPAEVRVLAASVEPARAPPGTEIVVRIVYSVAGPPPGTETAVVEQRVVKRGGSVLTTLRAEARRAAGVHESNQKLRLPADVAPGVYEVEAHVAVEGRAAAAAAVFQVTGPGER
jgi:hypothetical protein